MGDGRWGWVALSLKQGEERKVNEAKMGRLCKQSWQMICYT